MAIISATNVAPLISEVWDAEVLQARYAEATILNRVLNKSELVADSGQIIHITVVPRFVGGTVGTDGAFTPETQTLTAINVNVNTWQYVSVDIPIQQSRQSVADLKKVLPAGFGKRLAERSDIALADLFTSFTGGNVGSAAGPEQFIEDAALGAVLQARKRDLPLNELSWFLSPECFYDGWLTKERMTNANTTGMGKSALISNWRGPILNISAYESNLLDGASGNQKTNQKYAICGLVHKEALAYAMQIQNKYYEASKVPAGFLGDIIVAASLYGTVIGRANHGIRIFIKNK